MCRWIHDSDWCLPDVADVTVMLIGRRCVCVSGFMILIGAGLMSLMFIGALKLTSRQYPQNYICLAMFVSRTSSLHAVSCTKCRSCNSAFVYPAYSLRITPG